MEVVPLSLELGGGVHLVRHDAGDGLRRRQLNFHYQSIFKFIFKNEKNTSSNKKKSQYNGHLFEGHLL